MNAMPPLVTRVADASQILAFADALFRYADAGTFVSLRAFFDTQEGVFDITPHKFIDPAALAASATRLATKAANAVNAVVFSPPVATFNNSRTASEGDLSNGLALSVECDQMPAAAREKLESLLGPATVIVASGGEWTDPDTGEIQDRVHLHWRANEPTRSTEEHLLLKRTRTLASALVGGDASNKPSVHPIRWAGTWHRKNAPRLASIVSINPEREIDLREALERLQEAANREPPVTHAVVNGTAQAAPGGQTEAPGEDRETAELVRAVLSGEDYHAAIVALAMRWLKGGMLDSQAVITLRGVMLAIPPDQRDMKDGAVQMGRWQARYDDIPRAVSTARGKLGSPDRPDPANDPAPEPPVGPNGRGVVYGKLLVLGMEDIDTAPPRDYLLKGLLSPAEISIWVGAPKCGKSFLLLYVSYMLSLGRSVFGRRVKAARVLYVAAEGEAGIANRIRALRDKYGDSPNFHFIAQPADLLHEDGHRADLVKAAKAVAAQLIVLDTLSRLLAGGDENSPQDMGAFVRNVTEVRHDTNAHVAIVHHGTKASGGSNPRGHSCLTGADDALIEVVKQEDGRVATVVHAKDDADGMRWGFDLGMVELGTDDDGDPITTLIVNERTEPAAEAARPMRLSDNQQIGMKTLHAALKASAIMATVEDNHAARTVVAEADWRVWFYREGKPGESAATKTKAFRRIVDGLLAKDLIGSRDGFVWPTGRCS